MLLFIKKILKLIELLFVFELFHLFHLMFFFCFSFVLRNNVTCVEIRWMKIHAYARLAIGNWRHRIQNENIKNWNCVLLAEFVLCWKLQALYIAWRFNERTCGCSKSQFDQVEYLFIFFIFFWIGVSKGLLKCTRLTSTLCQSIYLVFSISFQGLDECLILVEWFASEVRRMLDAQSKSLLVKHWTNPFKASTACLW